MSAAARSGGLTALSVFLSLACGPGGEAPQDTGDVCDTLSVARCQQLRICAPAELAVRYGDLATCESQQYFVCNNELTATGTGLTAAHETTCAQAVSAQACTDFLNDLLPAACNPVAGKRAANEVCAFSSQCASTYCAVVANTPCGTCQPPPTAGSSCASTPCGPAFVCDPTPQTCVAGLTCVAQTALCAPDGTTSGATCDPQHVTAPDCDARLGLTCEGSPPTCQQSPLAGDGAACGAVGEQFVSCQRGACALPEGQSAGVCQGWAPVDESCDTQLGPDCQAPARCITTNGNPGPGTCLLPADSLCTPS
jgi:hypothetical protein